jgi:hypothetical protein
MEGGKIQGFTIYDIIPDLNELTDLSYNQDADFRRPSF